jgi:hypothetical protein
MGCLRLRMIASISLAHTCLSLVVGLRCRDGED